MGTAKHQTLLVLAFLTTGSVGADSSQQKLNNAKDLLKASKYQLAIEELDDVIRLEPLNAVAFFYRGTAFSALSKVDKALPDFSAAIRLNPKHAEAFFLRGKCYYVAGDRAKALADFTEAFRLDERIYQAVYYRAMILYEKAEYAKAIGEYQRGIRLAPKDPVGYSELARVLAVCPDKNHRDGRKAIEYATEACKMTEWKVFTALEALAAGYAEVGKFDDAIKWQTKAVDVSPLSSSKDRLKQFEEHKPLRYESLVNW